jgi:hypothetical protein
MSPNQAIPAHKLMDSSSFATAQPLTILSWREALNASGSRRARRMAINRNASSLLVCLRKNAGEYEPDNRDQEMPGRRSN